MSEELIAYLKGELARDEAERVKSHLAACQRCSDEALVLDNAFNDIACLPTYHVSFDMHAIEEAAGRRATPFSLWWKVVPAFAGAAALLICGFILFGRISTTRIAGRPQPSQAPRPPVVQPSPEHTRPAQKKEPQTEERQIAFNGKRSNRHRDTPRGRTEPRSTNHEPDTVNNSSRDESVPADDSNTLIAQYVDTMAMCMAQSDNPRVSISCSIVPVTAADDRDLPVADTLTAVLVGAFKDRQVTIDINRLSPTDMQNMTASQIAKTVKDEYVIVGSVEKAKDGYLLSLYAFNKHDDSIVFNGDHPILLPTGMFYSSEAQANNMRMASNNRYQKLVGIARKQMPGSEGKLSAYSCHTISIDS